MKMHADYSYLEKALDADRMRPFFEKHLAKCREAGVPFDDFYIPRVFPREADSFAVQYVVRARWSRGTPSEPLILWGYVFGPDRKLPAYVARPGAEVIVDHDLGLVVPIFPFDPALPTLKQLCDPVESLALLRNSGLVDKRVAMPSVDVDVQVLAYRLERRCVLRYNLPIDGAASDYRQIVVRAMRPKKLNRVNQSLSWLAANGFGSGSLGIPKVLATDKTNGLLFVEYVDGRTLHDLTGEIDFSQGCQAAAGALQKLHGLQSDDLPVYSAADELNSLKDRTSQIGRIFPNWGKQFEEAIISLELDGPSRMAISDSVCIHRDFYDKQVLWSRERATLLDCDTLASGDPALDYGNFLAHLVLRILQEPDLADNIDRGRKTFEQNLKETSVAFRTRVRWWQKASLVRLAALYSLRPRWHHLTGALLQMAAQINKQEKTELARE